MFLGVPRAGQVRLWHSGANRSVGDTTAFSHDRSSVLSARSSELLDGWSVLSTKATTTQKHHVSSLGYSFLLMALSAGSALSNVCPLPASGTSCISSFDPVECEGGCVYDNSCLAEAAGQSNCAAVCADPDPGIACTREYAPVICDGCLYDNSCLAEAAGKTTGCSGVCPTPGSTVSCTLQFAPVICDGCVYSNTCNAEAAGNSPANCILLEPELLSTCPEPAPDVACILSYQPVECADGCTYDNECLAEAAGQSGCSDVCPVPGDVVCTLEYSPVGCADGCAYDNNCLAEAAGQTGCSAECPTPDPGTPCILNYDPVVCKGCFYSNFCLAEASGFSPSDCSPPVFLPTTQSVCPEPDPATPCILIYQPVECADGCAYDNECLAEAAGQSGCSTACPVPNSAVACTLEYSPVGCADGCTYDNNCLAEAAGQAGCSVQCPTPDPSTECTADYAPVNCGGCFYSNSCLAAGASGLSPNDCISASLLSSNLPDCPVPPSDTACILSYQPVACADGCSYDNECLAEAANQTGCSDVCPVPNATVACTLDYSPVVCGENECLYVNPCRAEAVGQSLNSCKEACPTSDPAAACTREYVPVLCKGCVFDNKCLAESAGCSAASIKTLSLAQSSEPPNQPPNNGSGAGLVEVASALFLAVVAHVII